MRKPQGRGSRRRRKECGRQILRLASGARLLGYSEKRKEEGERSVGSRKRSLMGKGPIIQTGERDESF